MKSEAMEHEQRASYLKASSLVTRHSSLVTSLRELTWDNPVLVKEFRTRMRGTRAYWVLLVYVLLLTLAVGIIYMNWYSETSAGGISHQAASGTGRLLFQVLFAFQAGLVALITPAITAGAVTIEREQQTYQMLATSGLKPLHIIAGKLLAAVSFVALLLTSSLPLVSLSFLLGGVSPGEVIGTYLSLALSAFVFGSIGILCSASLRATAAATVATYTAVLLLFFLTLSPGSVPGSTAPFRSVNAATAIYHSVDQEPFFLTTLPSWFIGVTLNLLMGLLFANMAMTKLEFYDDRRPIPVRGLATALWTAFLLFVAGNLYGQSATSWSSLPSAPRDAAVGLLTFAFGLLLAVLPIFTTGEWEVGSGVQAFRRSGGTHRDGYPLAGEDEQDRSEPDKNRYPVDPGNPVYLVNSGPGRLNSFLAGMLPHAAFRAELPAGAPLVGLWWAIAAAIVIGGFAAVGKLALFPADALPLLFTSVAVIAAFTALGNLLSVAFQDRKATMVLSYLTIAALCLLPFFGYMTWEASSRSSTPHLSWQFLYLTPFLSFVQMGEARGSFWSSNPPMLLGQTPFWLVTGAIYAALAVLLFALTLQRVAKQK
jgi:ABC-type transport system involved in multi-copper enzyme maturation permease subunit